MSLFFHEFSHLALSLLTGFIIWKLILKKIKYLLISLISGLISGFFIDLDHLFDYFLAFGFRFRIDYFLKGYQFLKSDKIYTPFHSFEIVAICLIFIFAVYFFKQLTINHYPLAIILVFSLSMFFHITFDIFENELPVSTYSIIYRINKNFNIKDLVYPDHYRYHLQQKKKVNFKL